MGEKDKELRKNELQIIALLSEFARNIKGVVEPDDFTEIVFKSANEILDITQPEPIQSGEKDNISLLFSIEAQLPYPDPVSKHQTDINIGWKRCARFVSQRLEVQFLSHEPSEEKSAEEMANRYVKSLHPSDFTGTEAAAFIAGWNATQSPEPTKVNHTDKIGAEEILNSIQKVYPAHFTELGNQVYIKQLVLQAMEKYASQFKVKLDD